MKIQIATRFKPFSHQLGVSCIIPGTTCKMTAYPTLLIFPGLSFRIPVTGPVRGFTLEQDLEKNCVRVFGHSQEGFYRLKVFATPQGIELWVDKAPKKVLLSKQKKLLIPHAPFYLSSVPERLFLGNQKEQNWDLLWEKGDLTAILPVLFHLAQKIPPLAPHPLKGVAVLLEKGELENFCRAAFSHLLVPRLEDDQYQGFTFEPYLEADPISLISLAFTKIRSLFFTQLDSHLQLLPKCPFISGKMICVQAPEVGELDFEWTKGKLRTLVLHSTKNGEIFLDFPTLIRGYRFREGKSGKKMLKKANQRLEVELGKTYFLDRFQT